VRNEGKERRRSNILEENCNFGLINGGVENAGCMLQGRYL